MVCLMLVGCIGPAVFANDGNVETTFFGNLQDDGNGCGVYTILNFVIEILTFGVGIAAVIGITISGITYMTAGGNEAQTVKAKRRIYEIVIGLAAYAVLWAILSFLLPGGVLNNSPVCKEGVATDSFFTTPVETADRNGNRSGGTSNESNNKNKNDASSKTKNNSTPSAGAQKVLDAAKYWANKFVANGIKRCNGGKSKFYWSTIKSGGCAVCHSLTTLAARTAGLISEHGKISNKGHVNFASGRIKGKSEYFDPAKKCGSRKVSTLVKKGCLLPGDIIGEYNKAHTMIYGGYDKKNKKYWWMTSGSVAAKHGNGSRYVKSEMVHNEKTAQGTYKLNFILRAK